MTAGLAHYTALYPATYRDRNGEEITAIHNDGKTLRMVVRGVEFVGRMLDDFAPVGLDGNDPALASFHLGHHPQDEPMLCDCVIAYDMPLPVVQGGVVVVGKLRVRVDLGAPTERGGLDHEAMQMTLHLNEAVYRGSGASGWFEDELIEIQRALPTGTYLQACIGCQWGDYGVGGHGAFGCMLCFRGSKRAYLAVQTKRDYLTMKAGPTEQVQRTYLCPEFQRRGVPGTGYRG